MDLGLLKCAAPLIAGSVAHMFYYTFLSGSIPTAWKSVYVLPILKVGDTNDLDNYRPISRLRCLATIFEFLVNVQLCSF